MPSCLPINKTEEGTEKAHREERVGTGFLRSFPPRHEGGSKKKNFWRLVVCGRNNRGGKGTCSSSEKFQALFSPERVGE